MCRVLVVLTWSHSQGCLNFDANQILLIFLGMGGAEGGTILDIFSLCWSVGTLCVTYICFHICNLQYVVFYVSGKRFNYTFYDKSCGKIWQSIETLDKAVCIHLISL